MNRDHLKRFAWLSVAAALITIVLKGWAWWLTGSVGLLSDAMESFVNLAAAVLALAMLSLAARPPDEEHAFGYGKAEYFSSGVEGLLIFVAAIFIGYAAVQRLLAPQPIQQVGIGIAVSVVASLVNLTVARILHRAASTHRSVALEADAQHLMTDVWTSAGVIVGVAGVAWTGWWQLDPLIALAVAAHILWIATQLLRRTVAGLLDRAMPIEERQKILEVLDSYDAAGVRHHALLTREAAGRSFINVHILVPGEWSVQRGHDMLEEIEARIRAAIPHACVFTHLEPIGDPASYEDIQLDR
ncbi:MAG TPA: cation diffusion facilitator family transporter [Burkholderiales bacterium]|nr:cation diffusion facilitator family transporter [Burkholderiales bacterium]